MPALLEVNDLRVRLSGPDGPVCVLDGISFQLDEAQTLGLVGQSGSGKSMTALAIMGFLPPAARASGQIRLRGLDLLAADEKTKRRARGRRIAMIFQEPMTSLNPTLSVGEQVAEALRSHLRLSARHALRRAIELLDEVGISDARQRAARFPHEFSGGMQQRVMIAMALACGPEVLIADEPTTALDVTTQAQVLRLLSDLQARHKLAILFITHDLALLAGCAQNICVLHDGVIVESGPAAVILKSPRHAYTRTLLESALQLEGSS